MSTFADMEDKLKLLNRAIVIDRMGDLPLYAQLKRGLVRLVEDHFEDGDRFFNEEVIGKSLGVSPGTVRRALLDLTGDGLLERRVAKGTFVRKRARSAAGTFSIGVFLPAYDSSFHTIFMEHLASQCWKRDFRVRVYHTRSGEEVARAFDQVESTPQEEGFVLLGNSRRETFELYRALENRGFATVNIDMLMDDYPGSYLGVDNEAGICMGLEYLSSLGHTRVTLLVNEPPTHGNVLQRRRAFENRAREYGIEFPRVVVCDKEHTYTENDAIEDLYLGLVDEAVTSQVLDVVPSPTAIFAVSDPGACIMFRRLAERGVKVPQEMSVLGFGDEGISRFVHPGLTTVGHPYAALAERAVNLIEERASSTHELLRPDLVVRESVVKPPD